MNYLRIALGLAATSAVLLYSAERLNAVEVRVTIRNLGASDSFALSPIIMAAHDGSVDLFTAGQTASAGIENVAELGSVGEMLRDEIVAAQSNAVTEVGAATSGGFGPGIVIPGAEASYVLSLDPTDHRYFSFASMVVPSNDAFIGNDNPMGIELFDAGGNFAASDFELTSSQIWDAGSEINGVEGAAYITSTSADLGADENGLVSSVMDLNAQFGQYLGLGTPTGTFGSLPPTDSAFVSFEFQVIPEPATAALAMLGFAAVAVTARRRK